MRCAVVCCDSKYIPLKPKKGLSYHGFPVDPEVLSVWIEATGNPDFILEPNAKICSKHFVKSDYKGNKSHLKDHAVPTRCLGETIKTKKDDEEKVLDTDISRKAQPSDVLACILNTSTNMNNVQVVQAYANQDVSLSTFTLQPNCSIPTTQSLVVSQGPVINLIPAHVIPVQINVPVNVLPMPGMNIINQAMPVNCPPQNKDSLSHTVQLQQRSPSPPCGIKIVDVNTLLQKPSKNINIELMNSPKILECKEPTNEKDKNSMKGKQNLINKQMPKNNPATTVFHVLNCLKIFLPGKFDLSKLIPNEKLVDLVIKYLKLGNTENSLSTTKKTLSTIIKAARMERKLYDNQFKPNPYSKIKDLDLQLALFEVLPKDFSMQDVSDDILNCICVILNQDVYTNCLHILHERVNKFANKNQALKEASNQKNDKITVHGIGVSHNKIFYEEKKVTGNKPEYSKKHCDRGSFLKRKLSNTSDEEHITDINDYVSDENEDDDRKDPEYRPHCKIKPPVHGKDTSHNKLLDKEEKVTENKPKYSKKSLGSDTFLNESISKTSDSTCGYFCGEVKDDEKKDPNYSPPKKFKMSYHDSLEVKKEVTTESNGVIVKMILNYLEDRKCSAEDVLANFRLIFYLCRSLNLKSKQSNIEKIKAILYSIAQKNNNQNNVNQFKEVRRKKNKKSPIGPKCSKPPIFRNDHIDKLKLKPVVVLQDVADIQIWEKHRTIINEEKKFHKSSGYYEQKIPACFQQKGSAIKYSPDCVIKHTNESYNKFRRITTKNNNNKIIFCLKYKCLDPGTVVFVKDFRNLSLGWVKGTIKKRDTPFKYIVEVDNGEIWNCVADQLRPLPDTEATWLNSSPRSHRVIKPKQLFDL